jgi:hypothetical protein
MERTARKGRAQQSPEQSNIHIPKSKIPPFDIPKT